MGMSSEHFPVEVFWAHFARRKSSALHFPSGMGIFENIPREELEDAARKKDVYDTTFRHTFLLR